MLHLDHVQKLPLLKYDSFFLLIFIVAKIAVRFGTPDGKLVWDSGLVKGRATKLKYSGPELQADATYYWRVRWCDDSEICSPWSTPSRFVGKRLRRTNNIWCRFDTAYFDSEDWTADWITGYNLMRKGNEEVVVQFQTVLQALPFLKISQELRFSFVDLDTMNSM